MGSVTVPNMMNRALPGDMIKPGYFLQSSRDSMARAAEYVTAEEWAELAGVTNASRNKHSMLCPFMLLLGTCAICFCPLVYAACLFNEKVTTDIHESPIGKKLMERGITLNYRMKTKFDAGGMDLTFSPQTPRAPRQQDMQAPPGQQ
mmetsp:Transcript_124621/g.388036  ORF Transcript_124621/g.388036 Transcript_124621/m.388036 type:complete len:147 (-) Transcript_124621:331-771(-)